ncbi:hypothetical protein R1sor_020029 [Riccia sorocarpa]|uniref:CASP-like protein n=1 Tax=Riccia sorocarpa TaxID=122646 RepID=A0ABD3IGY8_9MARC
MSHAQSLELARPEDKDDRAIEPVEGFGSPDHIRPNENPPLELPSSPYGSPRLQLDSPSRHSSPLALRSSPYESPQLGHGSPPLALRSSPYRSPSSPPQRRSLSSGSLSPAYRPTLHHSLSPSPPASPPRSLGHQNPPQQSAPETEASVPVSERGAAAGGTEDRAWTYEIPEPVEKPLPTSVDAYKPRGIRSSKKLLNAVNIGNVALRAFAAVFTLISFSVTASNKDTFLVSTSFGSDQLTLHFNDLFYLSYLLTANIISFVYAVATTAIFMYLTNSGRPVENFQLKVVIFALDQMLSYLLISASSSAATGIRAQTAIIGSSALNSFESQAYAGIAMSFIAFFLFAAVSLISGYYLFRRKPL